jgi:hypothetical protein
MAGMSRAEVVEADVETSNVFLFFLEDKILVLHVLLPLKNFTTNGTS